jgi:hypothetical protein
LPVFAENGTSRPVLTINYSTVCRYPRNSQSAWFVASEHGRNLVRSEVRIDALGLAGVSKTTLAAMVADHEDVTLLSNGIA